MQRGKGTRECLSERICLSPSAPMRTDDAVFQIICVVGGRTGKSRLHRTFLLRHACQRITVHTYGLAECIDMRLFEQLRRGCDLRTVNDR